MCYLLCVMERVGLDHVGVRELRQNLSVYLRRVRRGEPLVVTERGLPVATLQPLPAIYVLEQRGIPLRRGAGNLAELPPPVRLDPDQPLAEVLDDIREDRV
jgi:prevent-host-death family protein